MSVFNSWQGVKPQEESSDKKESSNTVHAGYQQGKNPLLTNALVSTMAISPHFTQMLANEASMTSTARNRI